MRRVDIFNPETTNKIIIIPDDQTRKKFHTPTSNLNHFAFLPLGALGFGLGGFPPPLPFFPRPLVLALALAALRSFFILGSTTLYCPFTPAGLMALFCIECFFATT